MNSKLSIVVLIIAVMFGFLLRGCLPSPTAEQQIIESVDNAISQELLVSRDSINFLLMQIDSLSKQGVNVVIKQVVKHDTIQSSPQIVTKLVPYETIKKVTDTVYLENKKSAEFKNEYLYARIIVGSENATLDSLAVFDESKAFVKEVAIDKYTVQRSVMFQKTNPYISKTDGVYVELPRLTEAGMKHFKDKEMQKGLFWGVLGGAVLTATYFLLR